MKKIILAVTAALFAAACSPIIHPAVAEQNRKNAQKAQEATAQPAEQTAQPATEEPSVAR